MLVMLDRIGWYLLFQLYFHSNSHLQSYSTQHKASSTPENSVLPPTHPCICTNKSFCSFPGNYDDDDDNVLEEKRRLINICGENAWGEEEDEREIVCWNSVFCSCWTKDDHEDDDDELSGSLWEIFSERKGERRRKPVGLNFDVLNNGEKVKEWWWLADLFACWEWSLFIMALLRGTYLVILIFRFMYVPHDEYQSARHKRT